MEGQQLDLSKDAISRIWHRKVVWVVDLELRASIVRTMETVQEVTEFSSTRQRKIREKYYRMQQVVFMVATTEGS